MANQDKYFRVDLLPAGSLTGTAGGSPLFAGQGLDGTTYVISHDRCTECVGHFAEPQCASACPIGDCCVPDPQFPESTGVLLERARRLHPHKEIRYDMVWPGVRG